MAPIFPGVFGSAGFDPRSEEEILNQQRLDQQNQAIQQGVAIGGQSPADRTASVLGATLANRIGEKFNPTELSPDQQRQQTIQDEAKVLFSERVAQAEAEGNPLNLDQQNDILGASMARAALNNGDMATFSAIQEQTKQRILQNRLVEAQINAAEGKTAAQSRPEQVREIITDAWGQSVRSEIKEEFRAAEGYNQVVEGVTGAMESILAQGGEIGSITGQSGAVTGALNSALSLVRTLPSIAGNIFRGGQRDEKGDIVGGERLGGLDDTIDSFNVAIPASITGAKEQGLYKSLMIQLAYAQWRAQEGSGARQASDQDIERALDAIGARSEDPRVVTSTLAQNHNNQNEKLQVRRLQEYVTGDLFGLQPQEVDAGLWGVDPEGWEAFDTRFQASQDKLQSIATSGQAPTSAGQPAQESDDDFLDRILNP